MLSRYPIYAAIPVTDVAKAKDWYREKLGLEPADDAPFEENPGGVFLEAGGGIRFLLFLTYESPGSGATVAEFAVGDDIEQVVEGRGRGVVFEEYDIPGMGMVDGIATIEGEGGHRWPGSRISKGTSSPLGGTDEPGSHRTMGPWRPCAPGSGGHSAARARRGATRPGGSGTGPSTVTRH